MAGEAQKIYPQAYIAQGNGDLIQVTDFTFTTTNNAKLKHTLRQKSAGFSLGTEESNLSFNTIIDEDGEERNWWRAVQRGSIKQLRVKLPGGTTLVYDGVYKDVNGNAPLDDAVGISVSFIGKLDLS